MCVCACVCVIVIVCVLMCMCVHHQDLCAYGKEGQFARYMSRSYRSLMCVNVCVFVISTHIQGLTPPFHMHTDLGVRSIHTHIHTHTHTYTHIHTHTHTHAL